MEDLCRKYLDHSCFKIVQGGADVAKSLSEQKFDLICFTGSSEKGKLVSAAAAKHLTPCIMELGGKNPLVIDKTADINYTAAKVLHAKFAYSG
mmetsp:Transcript_13056/g.9096  ORF Transcript_13056/g.9096 Transcript_13056/m.9096 type:complete len:93 (-) Transcript_13056:830-1108(-)|eukprot:CAMPEP_0116882464 /NCGR_PEP_ID=MMETSP0463-20121206/14702_1 /TAXON_ID=181622 /ORGANISM="Strombidinopsis sp, Strain SopsisLIS2011" /LENGTH=92 /DNA_ID=CAMNT_0004535687 /DNA_START=399 /DNA_END=677 /DNA_ORIENTATION=-